MNLCGPAPSLTDVAGSYLGIRDGLCGTARAPATGRMAGGRAGWMLGRCLGRTGPRLSSALPSRNVTALGMQSDALPVMYGPGQGLVGNASRRLPALHHQSPSLRPDRRCTTSRTGVSVRSRLRGGRSADDVRSTLCSIGSGRYLQEHYPAPMNVSTRAQEEHTRPASLIGHEKRQSPEKRTSSAPADDGAV
jgi:hypothetical protein